MEAFEPVIHPTTGVPSVPAAGTSATFWPRLRTRCGRDLVAEGQVVGDDTIAMPSSAIRRISA